MARLILVFVAVVLACAWVIGCSEDGGPAAPQPAPAPTTGTVVVNPSPDSLACSWQLTGPSSYSHNGTGGETLSNLSPGDYTLTWGAEAGWATPDPADSTQTLAAVGTVTFTGTYTPLPGSITVDAKPNSINAQWRLTGPASYTHIGMGDETVTGMAAGDYTLVWYAKTGWDRPSPVSETKTLADGGSLTFAGTYTAQTGTIVVDAEPNAINAPWTLTGPSSYSHSGTGDESIPGLTLGDYTITWTAVSGYDSPDPISETKPLAGSGSVTFTGTYVLQSTTGHLYIRPTTSGSSNDATWHLVGPAGYTYDGQGREELRDVDAGDYTITWDPLAGTNPPDPISETVTLIGGATLYVYGQYVALEAQIIISSNPGGIDAPWHLDGPGGYTRDGVGYLSSTYVPVGDYTITWGEVSGWDTPPGETLPVILHETTYFKGWYALIWDPSLTLITGGKFEIGSPGTVTCPR